MIRPLHSLQFFTPPAVCCWACLLVSCAGTRAPVTENVQVPVSVSCVNEKPARPRYEFELLPASASDGDKILALVRDWAQYRKYTDELEAVIAGCS